MIFSEIGKMALSRLRGCKTAMKVLIAGAADFIGFHTAHALRERGDEVMSLDRLNAHGDLALKEAWLASRLPHGGFRFVNVESRISLRALCATAASIRTPTSIRML